jgi:hypothetical protein
MLVKMNPSESSIPTQTCMGVRNTTDKPDDASYRLSGIGAELSPQGPAQTWLVLAAMPRGALCSIVCTITDSGPAHGSTSQLP